MSSSENITITGGKYRGRKISTPGGATHPMGSRERLALFNMLTGRIESARVLDAFAGSGALGIEALSRDALEVIFVDSSHKATEVIKDNLSKLGIKSGADVVCGRISKIVSSLGGFDIILADPPYDDFDLSEVERLVDLIEKDGILALSHPFEAPKLKGLKLLKTHRYAAAHISVYSKN